MVDWTVLADRRTDGPPSIRRKSDHLSAPSSLHFLSPSSPSACLILVIPTTFLLSLLYQAGPVRRVSLCAPFCRSTRAHVPSAPQGPVSCSLRQRLTSHLSLFFSSISPPYFYLYRRITLLHSLTLPKPCRSFTMKSMLPGRLHLHLSPTPPCGQGPLELTTP